MTYDCPHCPWRADDLWVYLTHVMKEHPVALNVPPLIIEEEP